MALFNDSFSPCLSSHLPHKMQGLNRSFSNSSPASVALYSPSVVTQDMSLVSTVIHDRKLKKVRRLLHNSVNPLESLVIIDHLQHLAIDYHFSKGIDAILSKQYKNFREAGDIINVGSGGGGLNLYNVSLFFRVLRQNGYHVPTDVFNSFIGKNGEFKQTIGNDLNGMMGFYEASQLAIEGEDILDQANAFCSRHLNELSSHFEPGKAKRIKEALENPNHKTLARFRLRRYLQNSKTEHGIGTNDMLHEIAKLDFNIVQSVHQSELAEVSKWWRELGLAQELKFARDQPLKWYMWSMAVLADPVLTKQRIELTKPISLIYILDDIFDVCGTLNELVLLTEVINKWDINAIEQLPYSMKIFFKALYDTTEEISYKVYKEHGWNPINSLKKAWTSLCNAFLVEAKWFARGQLPKAEEYLKNGVVSTGLHVVLIHLFFLLGHGLNNHTVDFVDGIPGVISYPATILRLWDDLGSAMDEHQEGYDGSYIKCHMHEHRSSTLQSAQENVMHMISKEWKKLNKECLSSNQVPPSLSRASLNAARMVRTMYSYDENHRLLKLEELVKSLLYDRIPMEN